MKCIPLCNNVDILYFNDISNNWFCFECTKDCFPYHNMENSFEIKQLVMLDIPEQSKLINDWNEKKAVLKKLKNGTFKGTVDLESGNSYEFKYVVDGVYVNDEAADAYAWNDFAGAENGVINL